MTGKQGVILDELRRLRHMGLDPTVRSLADRLEQTKHRSERWSDDEVRGLLKRLEKTGHVVRFTDDAGAVRYRPVIGGDPE